MIRFSRYYLIYLLISASILVPGVYSLVRHGLKQSIDFTGGTLAEVRYDREISRETLADYSSKVGIESTGITQASGGIIYLRLPPDAVEKVSSLSSILQEEASISSQILRVESVGPLLGKELLKKAIIAAAIAIFGILLYVAYAFRNILYGLAAVIALTHDLLVMMGIFSIFGVVYGVEVDTLFVTALLTTMSFSVHDTIVVFDRIREMKRKGEGGTFQETSDIALTQTMVRSLINSFTIIFMLVSLVLLGGSSVRWFAVALLIGTVTGTYSSPFVATPILVLLQKIKYGR